MEFSCGAVSTGRVYWMACANASHGSKSRSNSPAMWRRRPILLGPAGLPGFQGLGKRDLLQGVFRAGGGNRAAVAVDTLVVAHPQSDGAEAERLLALHHTAAASIALFLVNDILVEIVGRILWILLSYGLAGNGVTRAELLTRHALFVHRARDVVIRGADVAPAAL